MCHFSVIVLTGSLMVWKYTVYIKKEKEPGFLQKRPLFYSLVNRDGQI